MSLYIAITENILTKQKQRYVVLGYDSSDAKENLFRCSTFSGTHQILLTIAEMSSLAIRVD